MSLTSRDKTIHSRYNRGREMLAGIAKKALNRALNPIEHVVLPKAAELSPSRLVAALARYGIRPATVFDIGVAFGTPWLYEGFPQATLVLVDPTRESIPHMQNI